MSAAKWTENSAEYKLGYADGVKAQKERQQDAVRELVREWASWALLAIVITAFIASCTYLVLWSIGALRE